MVLQSVVVSKARARFQRIQEIGAVVGYFHRKDLVASAAASVVQAFAFAACWKMLKKLKEGEAKMLTHFCYFGWLFASAHYYSD